MRSCHTSRGFTLIELSIVLVVIGLIIGSVLVGTTILQNARVTSTVNTFQALQAAASTYHENYSAWPGDDPDAETRFSSGVNTHGDGDGIIGPASLGTGFTTTTGTEGPGTGESANVWQHLRAAGLVKGTSGSTVPSNNSFGGVFGFQNGAFTGSTGIAVKINVVCASNVPGSAAQVIDQRLDDGKPDTGIMRGGVDITGAAATITYTDTSTYTLCMKL